MMTIIHSVIDSQFLNFLTPNDFLLPCVMAIALAHLLSKLGRDLPTDVQ